MEETIKDMLIGAWVLVMIGLSFILVLNDNGEEDMGVNSIILVLIIVTTIGITKYFS